MNEYQGNSNRLLVEIKDSGGTVINPTPDVVFTNIEVFVVHRTSNKIAAQYSIPAKTGFKTATVVDEDGLKLACVLDTDDTINAQQGSYEAQVDTYIADVNFEGGKMLKREKGILFTINPAVNGL